MKTIGPYLKAALKVTGSFVLPTALLIFLYEALFQVHWDWTFFLWYIPLIGMASARHYVPATVDTGIPVSPEFVPAFMRKVAKASWRITDQSETHLLLTPRFDRLYTWLYGDRVRLDLSGDRILLTGPRLHVKKLRALMDGKRSPLDKPFFKVLWLLLIIFLLTTPVLVEYGFATALKIRLHEYKTRDVPVLTLEETGLPGNTENNLNSYGGAVETEDCLFYVKDHLKLCRSDKDFLQETVLIDKPGGSGISQLNAAGEWLFFTSGKTLNRIKTDGSQMETLYSMGYLLDVHLLDNWIYFISLSDRGRLYKMDVNGRQLHAITDVSVRDFSLYDGRIHFSCEKNGQGVLKSMDLEGTDQRFVADIDPFDLVRKGDVLYYTDRKDFSLCRYPLNDEDSLPQKLVAAGVSRFLVVEDWIYFSMKGEDVGYPGAGLFRMPVGGGFRETVTEAGSIEFLSGIGKSILFYSAEGNEPPSLKRMPVEGGPIVEMN